jgi:hypothetical protein
MVSCILAVSPLRRNAAGHHSNWKYIHIKQTIHHPSCRDPTTPTPHHYPTSTRFVSAASAFLVSLLPHSQHIPFTMPPKTVKKVMTLPINVIFSHLQVRPFLLACLLVGDAVRNGLEWIGLICSSFAFLTHTFPLLFCYQYRKKPGF